MSNYVRDIERHNALKKYYILLERRGFFEQRGAKSEFARVFGCTRQYVRYLQQAIRQQEVSNASRNRRQARQ